MRRDVPACKVQAWEVSQRRRKAEGVLACSQKRGGDQEMWGSRWVRVLRRERVTSTKC